MFKRFNQKITENLEGDGYYLAVLQFDKENTFINCCAASDNNVVVYLKSLLVGNIPKKSIKIVDLILLLIRIKLFTFLMKLGNTFKTSG